ncbi:hypothetical protein K4L44_02995 [Halosquirtibacter laminarini]|uniref:Uncharacterized protein n=1 Tax=Halosquirtibacter laminarini TaxID=3374600 RepID=A0AC61NGU0_9BACT|nr:hypothetical protein K4L44_02995 [Prolixibacteraceae bacterium]
MITRNLLVSISLHLLGIISSTAVITLSVAHKAWIYTGIGTFVLILFSTLLIKSIYKIFNKIEITLLGVCNNDTSIQLNKNKQSHTLRKISIHIEKIIQNTHDTKKQLHSKELYFGALIDKSSTGLFSYDETFRVIDCNPKAQNILHLSQRHHLQSLTKIHPDLPDHLMNILKNNKTTSCIFESGSNKILFNTTTLQINNQKICLVSVNDVTWELNQNESEAWIKLSRTLSHEIMNAMTPMTSLSQIALGYFSDLRKIKQVQDLKQQDIHNTVKALTIIGEQAERLMLFVNNYRKFTQLPTPQHKSVLLKPFIEKQLFLYRTLDKSNAIQFVCNISEEFHIYADPKMLEHIALNIVKNAIEAFEEGQEPFPKIIFESIQRGNLTTLSIINNGKAIPEEIRENIFTPFYTTKAEGSGIGLSLSKQMMIKMGGNLTLIQRSCLTEFSIQCYSNENIE